MKFEVERLVRQPVERVFRFLADPRNRAHWQSSLRPGDVDVASTGAPHVGMHWQERPAGLGTFDMSIVTLEPERLWAEKLHGPGVDGILRIHFRPEGDTATRLRVQAELTLHGASKLLTPAVRAVLPRAIRRDLGRIDKVLARAAD